MVQKRIEVYQKEYRNIVAIRFRVSDVHGDNEYGTGGEIPEDIKADIIRRVYKEFGADDVNIDEFEDRGYLLIEITENFNVIG